MIHTMSSLPLKGGGDFYYMYEKSICAESMPDVCKGN